MKELRFSTSFSMAVVTVLGAGRLPKAPGTWGTLAALPLYFVAEFIRSDVILAFIIVFTLISLPMIKRIEHTYGQDPSFIVIDEAVGMWIVMLSPLVYQSYFWLMAGFLLFRLFDILKPYPISLINDKEGAFYVMFDDIIAAIFSLIVMHLTALIIPKIGVI